MYCQAATNRVFRHMRSECPVARADVASAIDHTRVHCGEHVPCCVSCRGIPEGTHKSAGGEEVRREETGELGREGMSRAAAFYTLHAVADKDHSNSAAASQRIGQARTCYPAIPGQSQIRPNQA